MQNLKDIRWRQRFENFKKLYERLERTVKIAKPSEAERGGLIQFFETSFELAWKTLKDYLESEGIDAKTPRDTLKQSFKMGLVTDGTIWMKMLEDRNLMSHVYDESESKKIENLIRNEYFPELKELYKTLKDKV